ncbi:MAG: hypothetical protein AB2L12_10270 [Smithellaceae bacterium]
MLKNKIGSVYLKHFMCKITSSSIIIPLSGFLLCIIIISSLNLAPMLTKKDGYVWSPLNSAQYISNDSYYYAAWMMEVTEGAFPPGNPSAKENADVHTVELFKLVPIVLSSFPALFLFDPRYIYFVSFTVFPGILFLLSYGISFCFTRNKWLSFSVGIVAVFYYWGWYSIQGGFTQAIYNLFHYPFTILEISDKVIDCLNDNFRFVNISVSGCVLLSLLLCLVLLQKRQTWDRFTLALFFCLVIAFTYLPMMVLSYVFLFIFCIIYFIRADRKLFWCFFSLGVGVLIFLLSIGYLGMIGEFRGNTIFLNEIFIPKESNSARILFSRGPEALRSLVMNAYFVVGLIALFSSWRIKVLRDWIIVFLITGVLIQVIFFIVPNDSFKARFDSRAYVQPFVIFSLIAITTGIKNMIEKGALMRFRYFKQVGNILCFIAISGLLFFPAVGFFRYAAKNTQTLASYIPQGQWDAFRWLQNNTKKDSVVLAIDWSDVYLVPIYTHNNLFFGHYIIENRSKNNEVDRYLSAWHLLALPRERLKEIVAESVSSYALLINKLFRSDAASQISQYPSQTTFESASFIHGLIYFPYNKEIGSINLESTDFLPYIMRTYDNINWVKVIDSTPCDYVLVSNFYWNQAASLYNSNKFRLVYENDVRRIYKVERR